MLLCDWFVVCVEVGGDFVVVVWLVYVVLYVFFVCLDYFYWCVDLFVDFYGLVDYVGFELLVEFVVE